MTTLDQWVNELAEALGVDPDTVDVKAILDLARDAAHAVERPAAPLTTYMVGYAAGLAAGRAATPDAEHRGATAPTAFARATARCLEHGAKN